MAGTKTFESEAIVISMKTAFMAEDRKQSTHIQTLAIGQNNT